MTSGKSARDQRAAKVAAQKAAARKAERRRRNTVVAGVVVAVLVVVVGVGALVQAGRNDAKTSGSQAAPANVTGAGGTTIVVGKSTAPVTVTLYEDFQCPICQQFEQTTGKTLKSLREKGTVKVEYRPIAILDRASSTDYSTRALNATACVVDRKPAAFEAFHDALFANQPPEGSAGLPDSKLAALAGSAGAGDVSTCITNGTFTAWTARVTDASSKAGVTGTPTVIVNGKTLPSVPTAEALTAAVQQAAKG